ncbi:hypothetical protein A9174_31545 [Mesorhizobium loti NZP2037]|uniref:Uncharacterized protein n=2 Tax=Phyllobacteriaceae TaxID=69277 RepID=M5AN58_RHILI|nr:hypothetical protein A9174_31545 [Mesorhizobium loti NZP2037]OBP79919.1 hypothetical protein BAE41_29135 [Mesorhizobium loti]OBP96434.1 hypothetical protein BAE38_29685 [Mesorhizobium loti]BAN09852.1 conserved hypothetical protein [Mesorhizobium loti NZP2037]
MGLVYVLVELPETAMDNTAREWPYDAPDDAARWVASLTGGTEDFIQGYQALRAQQAGMERQMSELNLGGSTADPDGGAIRRTSVGGSMRMPPQPDLRDNQFSSARHSIDTSYAASSRSRSRHSAASSEAYSSFSEEPATAPQPKKSGGLKSFLKTVKKAFVPSSGRKSSEGSRQQPELVLESTLRIDSAKRTRAGGDRDEPLFSEFRATMDEARNRDPDNSHAVGTVKNRVSRLRRFSGWLQLPPRYLTIASLLDDHDSTLADHAAAFVDEGGDKGVCRDLEVLRDSRAGNVRKSRPAPEDERLVSEFRAAMDEARNRDPDNSHAATTVTNWVSRLRGFSGWLQLPPRYLTIASLLDDNDSTLADHAAAFVDEGGDKGVYRDLEALRDSLAGNVRSRAGNVRTGAAPEDEPLFSEFRAAMDEARNRDPDNSHAVGTVKNWLSFLRRFSAWLQLHPRYLTIADLLDDNDRTQLTARAAAFVGQGGDKHVQRALEALRDWRAGTFIGSFHRGPLTDTYPEDEDLLKRFAKAASRLKVPPKTIDSNVYYLRGFSWWLKENNKPPMAFDSRFRTESINDHLIEYGTEDSADLSRVDSALSHLRRLALGGEEFSGAGAGPRVMGRRTLGAYAEDARLIDDFCKHSLGPETTAVQRKLVNNLASRQRKFSEWLQREGKSSIMSRLNQEQTGGLKDDFRAFKKAIAPTWGGVALDKLQKYQRVVAANKAWGMPPEQAGWRQQSGQSPASSYDPDPLWDELSERGRQGPAGSLDSYDQDEIHDAADQAGGRQPAGWEDGSWALSSQSDQPAPSPQSLNPTEFWAGVDQAGQLPTDSFNTANFWQGVPPPAHSPAQSVNQPSPAMWEQDIGASIFGPTYHRPASFDFEQHVPPDWGVPSSFPGPSTRTRDLPDDWQEYTASPPAGASLPDLPLGPFRQRLPTFLRRFNAYVGQASGQGLNCLLDTVLQLTRNTRRQDQETRQTRQLQEDARSLRNSLVELHMVNPDGEIDLYGPGGVGVLLADNLGVRIQAIEADANGRLTVHPILGQEGRLVHILHTPGHFQPLWPRHEK